MPSQVFGVELQAYEADFKPTEQCLVRLDARQRKITACQTTTEQSRASKMDAQAELADFLVGSIQTCQLDCQLN